MRDGFREIVEGWTLISGIHDLTDRIEMAAKWTEINGPLQADEEATIKLMIEAQIARGMGGEDDEYVLEECTHENTAMGYGLAGGGIGPYEYCEECGEILHKTQDHA